MVGPKRVGAGPRVKAVVGHVGCLQRKINANKCAPTASLNGLLQRMVELFGPASQVPAQGLGQGGKKVHGRNAG